VSAGGRRTAAAALGVLLAVLPACQAFTKGAAKEAGASYFLGKLEGPLEADVERAFAVAKKVVEDMGLHVDSSGVTEIDGEIVAYTARETKVHLELDAVTDTTCEVSIRVGSLGDEDLSLKIYERIRKGL
jgi:Protein of unknown function (DUF3568)